jgi:hypothetical protein
MSDADARIEAFQRKIHGLVVDVDLNAHVRIGPSEPWQHGQDREIESNARHRKSEFTVGRPRRALNSVSASADRRMRHAEGANQEKGPARDTLGQ